MRKVKGIAVLTAVLFSLLGATVSSIALASTGSGTYNPNSAAAYADQYAITPSGSFKYFVSSDCTNFVSQALRAGGWPYTGSSATDPYAWYYDTKGTSSTSDDTNSNTWSVAKDLYSFIVLNSNPARGQLRRCGRTPIP